MKIILSRKGSDSSSGGIPSPILPDGYLCSLPIPSCQKPKPKDLPIQKSNLAAILTQLKGDLGNWDIGTHLDPDLDCRSRNRASGWLPCFGQDGPAQSHLHQNGVGKGDLFLFFGWFRKTTLKGEAIKFGPQHPDIHCIFGWLQVGAIYYPTRNQRSFPAWASDHPHVKDASYYKSNTLYVASDRLSIPGLRQDIPGGGLFSRFNSRLQLTEPNAQRSLWRLPNSFLPSSGEPILSYHYDKQRWRKDDKGVLLKTVGRGQEFIMNIDKHPDILDWVKTIFSEAPTMGSRVQRTKCAVP